MSISSKKDISSESVIRAYKRLSTIYNFACNSIFKQGRKATVTEINNIYKNKCPEILEVGVGTGLSLPYYDENFKVTGIDLSKDMLDKARKLVVDKNLLNVIELVEMDAEDLKFEDNSYDIVVAMYVASVVPNVEKFLQEISRVCKPNGKIYIVNHFSSANKAMYFIEKHIIGKLAKYIGFQADMPITSVLNHPNLELLGFQRINLFGYWKLLSFKKLATEQ